MLFRKTFFSSWIGLIFLFSKELVCLRLMVNLDLIDIPQLSGWRTVSP